MIIEDAHLQFAGTLTKRKTTTDLVLHHAESENATVEDIHQWHLERGWLGIGYHYYIRGDGSVWRGRPEDTVGAQAKGANEFSIGICFEGNYQKDTEMPAAQLEAGKELIGDIKSRYAGIAVHRHLHYDDTDCPGRYFPYEALEQAPSEPEGPEPAPSEPAAGNPYDEPSGLIRKGDKGDGVRWVQWELNKNKYPVDEDGIFGADMDATIRSFQKDRGLSVDGIVGPKTRAQLKGQAGSGGGQASASDGNPYAEPAALIRKGDKGDGVRWVQWELNRNKYPVDEDGIFGADMDATIRSFQKDRGLSVDGIVGPKTRAQLKG